MSSRGVVVAELVAEVTVGAVVVTGFEIVTLVPPLMVGGFTIDGDDVTAGVTEVVLGLVTDDGVFSPDFTGVFVVLVVLALAVGVEIVVRAGVLEGVATDLDGVLAGVLAAIERLTTCFSKNKIVTYLSSRSWPQPTASSTRQSSRQLFLFVL